MIAYHRSMTITAPERVVLKTVDIFKAMLGKLMRENGLFETYVIAWDSATGSAWRKAENENYKSTRSYNSDIVHVFQLCREAAEQMACIPLEHEHGEADDLLYAYAKAHHNATEITIISGDRDLLQIVQRGYAKSQWDPIKKRYIEVPEYDIVTYKALVGDSSDNIAGVRGVGDKRALKLLSEGVDTLPEDKYTQFAAAKRLIDFEENPYALELKAYVSGVG